jgi:hypothetical protein
MASTISRRSRHASFVVIANSTTPYLRRPSYPMWQSSREAGAAEGVARLRECCGRRDREEKFFSVWGHVLTIVSHWLA